MTRPGIRLLLAIGLGLPVVAMAFAYPSLRDGLRGAGGGAGAGTVEAVPFERVVVDDGMAGDVKLVGDIDGDGHKDLVVGGGSAEKLAWYRHPDWSRTTVATPTVEFTTDGSIADVDADGDLDIVVPDGDGPDNLLWFENPRPGGDPADGASWRRWVIGSVGGWGKDVHPADYDGDGRLDIATRSHHALMIFFQTAPGDWERVEFPHGDLGNEGLAHGDVDGDGLVDLVVRGAWIRNPGAAAARDGGAWVRYPIGEADADFKALVADVDGDGRAEVIFASSENTADVDRWTVGDEGPAGPWVKHTVMAGLERGHTLQAGDMDLDGDTDLVVAQMHTAATPRILVLLNADGRAGRWLVQVVGAEGLHNGVVADMDEDGDLDIFGANWTGHPPVRLWINRLDERT
ncbi:FG-GAP repeat domain-containing protein [Chthonobacter rhizosphaerae]|uniref:FG-GAP repeat domain-containing protein n=1 Tax=Chthonobacter rhizosphaerae TaxID=2735553 RepID=UPI0015EF8D81|nr:VCBS repeat-containing protein [Chthonobacter rhizosphaerae]